LSERIRFFGEHRCRLGESPVWDDRCGRLWWIDAIAGRILSAGIDGAVISDWVFDQPVGSIALSESGLIAALADGFYAVNVETGQATPLWKPEPSPDLRFNDGKTDRTGGFLSGQLERVAGEAPAAALYRLDGDGRGTLLVDGLRLTNAICFSPDGATIYFADSLEGVIRRHAYDEARGTIGDRLGEIDCHSFGSGPDGATIDADGNLWVALVLAQGIACIAPDGTLLRQIALPIPYPSCPAFGGPDRDVLYVSSISDSEHRLKSDHPDAGRILAIEGLGVRGVPEARWPGSHP